MSGGAEMIAAAVVQHVGGMLGQFALERVEMLWCFQEDVGKMKDNMTTVQSVLEDAENRSGNEGASERLWLRKLKSVAYNIEDTLEELEVNAMIRKNSRCTVKLCLSSHNPLVFRLTMASKMKAAREELDKVVNEHLYLKLVPRKVHESRKGETFAPIIVDVGIGTPTNVDVDIGMVGRGKVKENIMSLLLESETEEDISIIPIIGLGGLGKTKLAQSVFADKRVTVFDVRAWVYVSKEFDLKRIGKAIISSVDSNTTLANDVLEHIARQVQKILTGRRFFLVLDDLWEESGDKLENLRQMLQHGRKGSKIILTTRMEHVVQKLRAGVLANQRKFRLVDHPNSRLELLSEKDCWEVMRQRAFGPGDENEELEEIGKKIAADKCGGLPIVANALGHIMCQDQTKKAWEDIKDRKVILDLGEGLEKNTLECLMLSYYYMLRDFKLCFTYFAVFPKGFVVDTDRLIQQWSALGYIQAKDGEKCINYLLGMSFLQISESSSVTSLHAITPRKLTMHELVHDLAKIIAANEFVVLDSTNPTTWIRDEKHYCRYARLVNYQNQSHVLKEFPDKIRSLHLRDCMGIELPEKAFTKSRYLRVLDLSGCSFEQRTPENITIMLPSSISNLMLLKYLDASGLPIARLPKSFHKLQNLRTLIVSDSSLKTLPDNIDSHLKLCYLDLSGSSCLLKLPMSFGNLPELSFVNLSGCCKLEELPESISKLKCLVHLDISKCGALRQLPAQFGRLPKLSFLNLSGCSKLTELPSNLRLDSLEYLNLSNCYGLQNLPNEFGNLRKLEVLNLADCCKLQVLPESFCQLIHLKVLDLSDCDELRELPVCFGELAELQYLNLTSCSKVQQLPESLCKLLKLKHLNLSFCLKLQRLPSSFGNLRLQMLDINGCIQLDSLPDGILNMTNLSHLEAMIGKPTLYSKVEYIKKRLSGPIEHIVHDIDNGGHSSIIELGQLNCRELMVKGLENVKHWEDADRAKLCNNSELRLLVLTWNYGSNRFVEEKNTHRDNLLLEKLVPPRTLEHFGLEGYVSKDLAKWMFDISSYLPYLSSIVLVNLRRCDCLPPFGQLPNLRNLYMGNLPNIKKIGREFYGQEATCKKLRLIELSIMENLEEWWTTRSADENEEFLIPNLHLLDTEDCPKLKFLPYAPRSAHWYMDNSDDVLPAQGFGKLSCSTLPFSLVIVNCKFSPDKWDRLEHLCSLEIFEVRRCRDLRTLPKVIQRFTSLRILRLKTWPRLNTLPDWLGNLVSLEEIDIRYCFNLTSLPQSLQKLTSLKKLCIVLCPSLVERCKGEDAHRISHIQNVILN